MEKCVKNIQGHEKYVYYLALDLNDDLITSGSGDYTIRQWVGYSSFTITII